MADDTSKVWLQTWAREGPFSGDVYAVAADGSKTLVAETDPDDAALVVAAPDAIRVLLGIEWSGDVSESYRSCCPDCVSENPVHGKGCELDAALKKAGFPHAQSRDDAREVMKALRTLKEKGGG